MVHEQQTFVSQSGLRGGPDFLRRFLVLTTISPQKAFSKNNGCVACGKLVVAHQWSCGARAQMLLEVCVLKRLANHALRGEAAGAQSVASCASCTVDTQRPPTHTHTWTYGVRFRRQTGGRNTPPLLTLARREVQDVIQEKRECYFTSSCVASTLMPLCLPRSK